MKTILEELNLEPTDGDYGVEIEAEGDNLPSNAQVSPIWRRDEDGSLRAGYESAEYVMRQPLTYDKTLDALDILEKIYKNNGTKVYETQTSGVHVHVNVQKLTIKQLITMFCAYYAIDELITMFCGPSRVGNHFCLRGVDAEALIDQFRYAIKNRDIYALNTDELRYASMNVVSLFKYGSLEFRAMRGTQDFNAIRSWVNILHNIKTNSLKMESPEEVVSVMSVQGTEGLLRFLLGDAYSLYNFIPIEDKRRYITNGIRLIQPLAYSNDWKTFTTESKNPFVVKPLRRPEKVRGFRVDGLIFPGMGLGIDDPILPVLPARPQGLPWNPEAAIDNLIREEGLIRAIELAERRRLGAQVKHNRDNQGEL